MFSNPYTFNSLRIRDVDRKRGRVLASSRSCGGGALYGLRWTTTYPLKNKTIFHIRKFQKYPLLLKKSTKRSTLYTTQPQPFLLSGYSNAMLHAISNFNIPL